MIKLTDLEKKVLDAITKDDFYEEGLNSCLWADCVIDTVKGYYKIDYKKTRAIFSSLIKKNIINPILPRRDENTITFTAFGKSIMRELGYEG